MCKHPPEIILLLPSPSWTKVAAPGRAGASDAHPGSSEAVATRVPISSFPYWPLPK